MIYRGKLENFSSPTDAGSAGPTALWDLEIIFTSAGLGIFLGFYLLTKFSLCVLHTLTFHSSSFTESDYLRKCPNLLLQEQEPPRPQKLTQIFRS